MIKVIKPQNEYEIKDFAIAYYEFLNRIANLDYKIKLKKKCITIIIRQIKHWLSNKNIILLSAYESSKIPNDAQGILKSFIIKTLNGQRSRIYIDTFLVFNPTYCDEIVKTLIYELEKNVPDASSIKIVLLSSHFDEKILSSLKKSDFKEKRIEFEKKICEKNV